MGYKLKWNYNHPETMPVLAVGITQGKDLAAMIIGIVSKRTHALFITIDHTQLFATEEGPNGLAENSLDEYTSDKNRVVELLYWTGWNDPLKKEAALIELATIRRRKKENKYGWGTLLCYVPVIGKWFKPDKSAEICSQNCIDILDKYGFNSGWKKEIPPNPGELLDIMTARIGIDVIRCSGYYCMDN